VNLAELNGPDDKLVIVVTEPLTINENWISFEPGELRVFESGSVLA
jgi:predicted glutamine amidotransferase